MKGCHTSYGGQVQWRQRCWMSQHLLTIEKDGLTCHNWVTSSSPSVIMIVVKGVMSSSCFFIPINLELSFGMRKVNKKWSFQALNLEKYFFCFLSVSVVLKSQWLSVVEGVIIVGGREMDILCSLFCLIETSRREWGDGRWGWSTLQLYSLYSLYIQQLWF